MWKHHIKKKCEELVARGKVLTHITKQDSNLFINKFLNQSGCMEDNSGDAVKIQTSTKHLKIKFLRIW